MPIQFFNLGDDPPVMQRLVSIVDTSDFNESMYVTKGVGLEMKRSTIRLIQGVRCRFSATLSG